MQAPLAAAVLIAALTAALTAQDKKKAEVKLPEGAGKDTVAKVCDQCHDLTIVTGQRQTKDGWQKKVDKMIDRGAQATDEEFDAIVNYLSEHFGKGK
jgi:cytochrome c5